MSVVIGMDCSTTATKAVAVDGAGAVLGVASAEYGYETPRPLWSEQDPALVVGRRGDCDPPVARRTTTWRRRTWRRSG